MAKQNPTGYACHCMTCGTVHNAKEPCQQDEAWKQCYDTTQTTILLYDPCDTGPHPQCHKKCPAYALMIKCYRKGKEKKATSLSKSEEA